jgi:hypothetical protein
LIRGRIHQRDGAAPDLAKKSRATSKRDHRASGGGDAKVAAVLELQRLAGNVAVEEYLQGASLTEAPAVQRAVATASTTEPLLVKWSSHHAAVKKLQQRLNAAGQEPPLKIDGLFGPLTYKAVSSFQSAHTLDADGKVGEKTWAALDEVAATPEIAATEDELGAHAAEKMRQANEQPYDNDRGIHYASNYKHDAPGRWREDFRNGYADPTYFERIQPMDWRLKPGMSASAAMKSWLRGLTIAECNSTVVAIEIDSLRAAIGDAKFDAKFGSTDHPVPEKQRLRIKPNPSETPIENLIERTEAAKAGQAGTLGHRPAKTGEWYYFYNHPKYLLKHPGGDWQGENALFMGIRAADGVQIWSGLGADQKTEPDLAVEMIEAYNYDRSAYDLQRLEQLFGPDESKWESYRDDGVNFPRKINSYDDIINAEPYTLHGTTRKGGFLPQAGARLSASKVEKLAEE